MGPGVFLNFPLKDDDNTGVTLVFLFSIHESFLR